MISGYESRPVFQYKYRPLPVNKSVPQDGGFSVQLYDNNILVFAIYDANSMCTDECCLALPARVMAYFNALMNNARSWLGYTPCDLRSSGPAGYGSFFAFDGFEPILIYGLRELLTGDLGSNDAYYARRVYSLFEDVCLALRDVGVFLTLDSFNWDDRFFHPFRRTRRGNTGSWQAI